MNFRASYLACCVALVTGCGSSPAPKSADLQTIRKAPERQSAVTEEQESNDLPSRCVYRKGACMPPVQWARKVCEDVYPDLALYMFRAGTPWTRFYMRTGLNAVNGWGPTIAEDLVYSEEVIPINWRRQREDFQVEGSVGTYDVLRWNGSCVTLDLSEVTSKPPSRPQHSRIDWKQLSEPMQQALLEDEEVARTYQARRKECRGASIGRVTAKCEQLDKQLVDVITEYVRSSAKELPPPSHHP